MIYNAVKKTAHRKSLIGLDRDDYLGKSACKDIKCNFQFNSVTFHNVKMFLFF